MNTPHVMVDIETLSTFPDAAIVSIGACFFSPQRKEVTAKFYAIVDSKTCVDAGLSVDTETLEWWDRQSPDARAIFNNPDAIPIHAALHNFAKFLSTYSGGMNKDINVWGNGAAFDNVVLSTAYRICGIDTPWEFWNDRCYRTMKNMAPSVKMNRFGTYHNALDDAVSQAYHLCDILHHLKIVAPPSDIETHCPDCGCGWLEHDFGVPKPMCP